MAEREKYHGHPLLFGLVLSLGLLLLTTSHLVRRWDYTLYDLCSSLFRRPAPTDIVILAIDEHSLAQLGRWPWSRRIHARILDKLSRCATRAVGLDILFAEPSPAGNNDDQELARAIRHNGRVILPLVNETSGVGKSLQLTRPLPLFARAAAGLGHVDVELDPDGIVRRTFLKAGPGRAELPTLALAMLMLEDPEAAHHLPGLRNPAPEGTSAGAWVRDHQVLIPFAGPPGHFQHISVVDFLDPSFDPHRLDNAYVLVGLTAQGFHGLPTPVSGHCMPMPGVELNATILDTLRTGQAILPLSPPLQAALGSAVILLSFFLYPHLRARACLTTLALLLALTLLASVLLLRLLHLWFPPVATLICLAVGYLLWSWQRLEWTLAALAREKKQALVTLQSIGDAVIRIDRQGRVRYLNPIAEQLTAWTSDEACGRPLAELVQLNNERHGRDITPLLERCLQADPPEAMQVDARLANRNGQEYIVHLSASTIQDQQQGNNGLVLGIRDLTETRALADRLSFQATHDPLTGLPNRALLKDRLGQAISRADHRGQRVAIYHVDMDSFKRANELLGRAGADQLLQEAATRLQEAAGDMTVSRLGADEFIVLQEGLIERIEVDGVAVRLLTRLRDPFVIQGQTVLLSASIGISLFPDHGNRVEELLRKADIALGHIKKTSGNDVLVFTGRMEDWLQERLALEKELRLALDNDGLDLHYQPQVRLSDGRLMGVEALLRWQTRDGRDIPPARFIPLAEESDLILGIGQWVMEKACQQAKAWQDAGFPPLTMAVNISPRQFLQKDFLNLIVEILERTGLEARYLELEITEHTIIRYPEHSRRFIHGFRKLGGTVAIDDFGTGYSSLSHLKQFPVDRLKIDRFFVRDIATAPEDAAITRAVISMAHALDLSVVAEGVETQAQLASLLNQECDKVQGYLLARPMSARELTVFLARGGSFPVRGQGHRTSAQTEAL